MSPAENGDPRDPELLRKAAWAQALEEQDTGSAEQLLSHDPALDQTVEHLQDELRRFSKTIWAASDTYTPGDQTLSHSTRLELERALMQAAIARADLEQRLNEAARLVAGLRANWTGWAARTLGGDEVFAEITSMVVLSTCNELVEQILAHPVLGQAERSSRLGIWITELSRPGPAVLTQKALTERSRRLIELHLLWKLGPDLRTWLRHYGLTTTNNKTNSLTCALHFSALDPAGRLSGLELEWADWLRAAFCPDASRPDQSRRAAQELAQLNAAFAESERLRRHGAPLGNWTGPGEEAWKSAVLRVHQALQSLSEDGLACPRDPGGLRRWGRILKAVRAQAPDDHAHTATQWAVDLLRGLAGPAPLEPQPCAQTGLAGWYARNCRARGWPTLGLNLGPKPSTAQRAHAPHDQQETP